MKSVKVFDEYQPSKGFTFFEQAEQYKDNPEKSGKFNRLSAGRLRVKHFRDFLGGKDIEFDEITKSLLAMSILN